LILLMASEISDPVNLGDSRPTTLTEVAERIINLTHSESSIGYTKGYKYIIQTPIPDISKVKEELGWFPLVNLENGLGEAIKYYKATAFLHQPSIDIK